MTVSTEGHLGPYAIRSDHSRGRVHPEPVDKLRSPFELDRHRIIESTAFRRLEHKTQVFAPAHHDHFRTRLTHTLEAAQIARCLAAHLRANDRLAEAITLAHDLGHPPFGHAGEAALDEAMAGRGGFNHNAHVLRVVDFLEHPFPAFRGLNLTAETRAGLLTHATRYDVPGPAAGGRPGGQQDGAGGLNRPLGGWKDGRSERESATPGEFSAGPSVEAQIASMADRLAYNLHDLEDAVGAEFIALEDLRDVALWHTTYERIAGGHDVKHIHAVRRVVLDAMLDTLLTDVIESSRRRLESVTSVEQVESSPAPLVLPSAEVDARITDLEHFLLHRVYRRPEIAEMDARGRRMVLRLFRAYRANTEELPRRFAARIPEQGPERVVCDYIAGMTDRFCLAEYQRLLPS